MAWQSDNQDGSGASVFGRRFAPDIFKDGFESTDLSAWSASATGNGHLFVHSAAAMKSTTVGVVGMVETTAGLYVQDDSPHDESRYRARFYFDPNGFDPGRRRPIAASACSSRSRRTRRAASAIVLSRIAGQYGLMGRARLVRMGALSVKPGADGTLYWDEFDSRRRAYVGP